MTALMCVLVCGSLASAAVLDGTKGKVEFTAVGRPSAIKINGHGPGPGGEVTLEKKDKAYSLSGEATFDLDALDTGIGMRDRHMKEKYLETGKHKIATLKLTDVAVPAETVDKGGEIKTTALLNLHGVEKPVDVAIQIAGDGDALKGVSRFKIKLSDYGIEIPKFSGVTVADDVDVTAETRLARPAAR